MDENELQRYKEAIMSQLQLVKEVGGLPHRIEVDGINT